MTLSNRTKRLGPWLLPLLVLLLPSALGLVSLHHHEDHRDHNDCQVCQLIFTLGAMETPAPLDLAVEFTSTPFHSPQTFDLPTVPTADTPQSRAPPLPPTSLL